MSTLLLSSQCDSVVTKICGGVIPVVKETYEAGTSENDVYIVAIICATIVVVAWIAKIVILSWKNQDFQEKENEREEKRNKEKEDSIRKQKADLLGKHLDFLKENASKDEKWIEDYKEVIASFKEALQSELNKCDVMNYNINGSDKEKIIGILEKQMEFLKSIGLRSNAKAEKKYQRVLAYLIEMSQADKMNKITQADLLDEQKDDPLSKQSLNKA